MLARVLSIETTIVQALWCTLNYELTSPLYSPQSYSQVRVAFVVYIDKNNLRWE